MSLCYLFPSSNRCNWQTSVQFSWFIRVATYSSSPHSPPLSSPSLSLFPFSLPVPLSLSYLSAIRQPSIRVKLALSNLICVLIMMCFSTNLANVSHLWEAYKHVTHTHTRIPTHTVPALGNWCRGLPQFASAFLLQRHFHFVSKLIAYFTACVSVCECVCVCWQRQMFIKIDSSIEAERETERGRERCAQVDTGSRGLQAY